MTAIVPPKKAEMGCLIADSNLITPNTQQVLSKDKTEIGL